MGLLDSVIEAAKQQYQTTKRGFGLLASNPQQFAQEATARYFPTKEEEAQFAQAQATGGDYMQTPYYQKVMNLSQFQGSIKPTGLLGTAKERMLEQGYDTGWYHGSTGDIKEFRPDLLGEATGAASAKQGFFFARDPIAPPKEMTQKSSDPDVIDFLKRLGKTDAEIEAMNTVSMKGHGANQASGYAQLGGDREYREAMRLASIAEKKGNWPEYEKQTAIAEDFAIGKNNQLQLLTAKHGEARDTMLSKIQDAWYSKPMSQKEAEIADAEFKKIMGYGWYNNPAQLDVVKKELINKLGKDKAINAIKSIDQYKSIVSERLAQESNSGANVLPIALRYKNPMVYDFKGSAYRDQTYSDLVAQAKAGGHDALIMRNTFDPGAGTAKLIDVGVMFNPSQIRSKFAQFDPNKMGSTDILAAGVPLGLLGTAQQQVNLPEKKKSKK